MDDNVVFQRCAAAQPMKSFENMLDYYIAFLGEPFPHAWCRAVPHCVGIRVKPRADE